MVEAELRESEAAEGGLHTGRGTKRRLGHDQDDEITDDRGPQKRRRGGQISLFSNGSARSGRPAREPSNHGPNGPKRAPGVPNNPCDTTRRSRRLAGDSPEFGMVRERRGALPLYEHYLQEPPAGSRSQQPGKGAKPQGISRSRETRTGSAKRLAKRLRG